MCEVGLSVKVAQNVYTLADRLGLVEKLTKALTSNLVFIIFQVRNVFKSFF